MAASMAVETWRDLINHRQISKSLKEHNAKESSAKYHTESKSIVCVYGSDLYVWDDSGGQLFHSNLKNDSLLNQNESESEVNKSVSTEYQKLCLSGGAPFDVDNVCANKSGTHMALWSSKGIKVLELPRRWGKKAMFEGGRETVMCRTISIGERSFAASNSVKIRQVSWHPGSKTDSHLAVLTSDTFSVYDIHEPSHPMSIVNVNTGEICSSHSPKRAGLVSSALGEIAVAFDFGLPVAVKPKLRPMQGSSQLEPIQAWPVYCVRGSGDIMLLYSCINTFGNQVELPVQGPVKMYPPAEDNYGVDACSVLCLHTPLPVIVVSTCEGRVHHCVQMPGGVSDSDHSMMHDGRLSPTSPQGGSYEPIPEPVLFVIETAELDLCLFTPGLGGLREEEEEDDFMCPIKLKKDPCSLDRYHCAHSAGVHSVALPWLNTIQQFFLDEAEDINLPEEKQCVVEHLLCTKPLHSCPLAPVLGLDIVSDPMLGPTLLILASDYNFTALPIGLQYQTLSSSGNPDDMSDISLKRNPREPFSQRIAQILQRKASIPLLKSGAGTELTQQECFQLLGRATQVLREEYIHKQDLARQEIDNRTRVLRQHKEHQLQDLKRLMESKLLLREHAGTLAEKLEAAKETHENLLKRLDSILYKIQSRVPVLSQAEKQMARELAKIKDNMELYTKNIEQVRLKQQYQERQLSKSNSDQAVVFKDKQLTQIRGILKEESEEIQDLKQSINRLSIETT